MVIWHNQLLSTLVELNYGGAIFLVEVSLHTASACPVVGISLLLLLLLCSSVRCGGALVLASSTHTAITVQSSRSLTYQPPARVRSPLTIILVGNTGLLLLHSVKKKLWLSLLIGCRHKQDVCFVTCQQEGACASSAAQRITTVVVTVVVVIWMQHESAALL